MLALVTTPNLSNDQGETESFYVNLVTINACFEKFVSRTKMFLILTPKFMKWRAGTFSDPRAQNKEHFCRGEGGNLCMVVTCAPPLTAKGLDESGNCRA